MLSSLPGKLSKTQCPPSAHKHCQAGLWWLKKPVEWCLCQPEQLHLLGVFRQFPDQPSNVDWNRCWYCCLYTRLGTLKASEQESCLILPCFHGYLTWVDCLVRYGAEAFICRHLNLQNLWTTGCSPCWTTSHPCTGGRNSPATTKESIIVNWVCFDWSKSLWEVFKAPG